MAGTARFLQAFTMPARFVAGFFAMIWVVGLLMFFGTFTLLTQAYFGLTFVALAAFAFLPRRVLPSVRGAIVLLGAAAIVISVPQMLADLGRVNGADIAAFVQRLLTLGLFAIMIVEAMLATRLALHPWTADGVEED